MPRTPRFQVRRDGLEVVLHVYVDGYLGEAGTVRRFRCPQGGGYVREIVHSSTSWYADGRPVPDLVQVCDGLRRTGATLTSPGLWDLPEIIRREARAALRAQDRDERKAS